MYPGKKNTDRWYPVIMQDADGEAVPSLAYGDVTVKYSYEAATSLTTYSITADDWKEAGEGKYWLRMGASEFTAVGGYQVSISSSTASHEIPIDVTTQSRENFQGGNSIEDKVWSCDPTGYSGASQAGRLLTDIATAVAPANVTDLYTRIKALVPLVTSINTATSQTELILNAGSPDDNAYNGCVVVVFDASTANQVAVGVVVDYVGATKTLHLLADPGIFTMAQNDAVYILSDRSLKPAVDNRVVDVSAAGIVEADMVEINGDDTDDNLATLKLKALDVINNSGDAIHAESTGGNGVGLYAIGNGTGAGLMALAGVSASAAIRADGAGNANGMKLSGAGDGNGLSCNKGAGSGQDIDADQINDILEDTSTTIPSDIATTGGKVDSILVDTGTTLPAQIAALNNLSAAEVNDEVVDALGTDALAEPSPGAPSATPTIKGALMYLYMAWRGKKITNKSTGAHTIYNDAGTALCKATATDGSTEFTLDEMGAA